MTTVNQTPQNKIEIEFIENWSKGYTSKIVRTKLPYQAYLQLKQIAVYSEEHSGWDIEGCVVKFKDLLSSYNLWTSACI